MAFVFQTLSHEPQVLKQGLLHLNEVLQTLEPLHKFVDPPGGSVLLRELANASQNPDAILSAQCTPLLHALSAAHAYITMFTHVCKVGQVRYKSTKHPLVGINYILVLIKFPVMIRFR